MDKKWITVEIGVTRKAILEEKLPMAQEMADHMKALALKKGLFAQIAEALFTLHIIEE